jgi:hypothetical protein
VHARRGGPRRLWRRWHNLRQHLRGAGVHGPHRERRERRRHEDADHRHDQHLLQLDDDDRLRIERILWVFGIWQLRQLGQFGQLGLGLGRELRRRNPLGRRSRRRRRQHRFGIGKRRRGAELGVLPAEPGRLLAAYWTGFVPVGYVTSVAEYSTRVPG